MSTTRALFIMLGASFVMLAVALALSAAGGQESLAADGIIYVDADATGLGNGTSWADAFTNLQPALDAAGAGDEIWVASGVYTPTAEHGGTGDRYRSFQLRNGVVLYGGFDPSVGDIGFEDRDWVLHETVLSGDLNGDDGPDFANNGENSYHVFYHPEATDLDSSAVLDGFTISGGNAADPVWNGAGMYNSGSSPTLTNCTIANNLAAGRGGGIYNYLSSPALNNCIFSGNSGEYGGGGMVNTFGSSPTLTNCIFSGNSGERGGGMVNEDGSSPVLTNCTFSGNSAQYGGGMYNTVQSSPTLTNCTFSGNSAGDPGGGMLNDYSSSPVLTNCTFADNAAWWGGGMANWSSSPVLTNCTFWGNSADSIGGGMVNVDSSPVLTNCTFWGNSADTSGAGMRNTGSSPVLTNCILWGDTPNEIFNDAESLPVVTYSNISGGYPGEGNLATPPWFVDPDNGDFHLGPCSRCIDGGDNNAPDLPEYDFEGDDRILDGNGDGTATVDMGVDEVAIAGSCFRVYLPLVLRNESAQ